MLTRQLISEELPITVPKSILELFRVLRQLGGKPFIVGGYVRDMVMSINDGRDYVPKDIDIVVFKMQFHTLRNAIKSFAPNSSTGNENHFPFISFRDRDSGLMVEVTTPRIGESKDPSPNATILQDALRRDLTISALYYCPITQKLLDVTGMGIDDIVKGKMRPVNVDYFSFDRNRLALAFNKASRFNLTVTQDMRAAATKLKGEIPRIPKDVLGQTLQSWAYSSGNHAAGLRYLSDCDITSMFYGLTPTILFDQKCSYHRESLWSHLYMVTDYMSQLVMDNKQKGYAILAAMWHDVGKLSTRVLDKNGIASYHGHEIVGASSINSVMRDYNMPKAVINPTVELIKNHMRLHYLEHSGDYKKMPLLRRAQSKLEYITMQDLADFSIADKMGRTPIQTSYAGIRS